MQVTAILMACCGGSSPLCAQSNSGLVRIPAGTPVGNPQAERWNTVLLLAQPRVASGDVEDIPQGIRDIVPTFMLTMLATVEPEVDASSGETRFRLAEVGVGFSTDIDGELIVVSVATQKRLGANLGLIPREMLRNNEKQLATARLIAKTSTLLIFDTPAILLREDQHQNFVMRHFIWIDSQTGKSSMLVWLLRDVGQGQYALVEEPMRWLPAGTKEDRKIHVDSSKFLLGVIPPDNAFALEDLPPGKPVPWTQPASQLASNATYDLNSLKNLTIALNEALQALRQTANRSTSQAR